MISFQQIINVACYNTSFIVTFREKMSIFGLKSYEKKTIDTMHLTSMVANTQEKSDMVTSPLRKLKTI